jgi:CBS domain-containing protein
VIVVDKLENGGVLGMITERMIMRATYNPDTMKVKTVAARIPRISSGESVAKAARLMFENHVLALPVEENGRIIGIITVEDVVHAMYDEFFSKTRVGGRDEQGSRRRRLKGCGRPSDSTDERARRLKAPRG